MAEPASGVSSGPVAPATGPGALLEVRDVSKVFTRGDRTVTAVQDVSLDVADGEFVCIIGPSGCGKSTLLHVVGGFEESSSGAVRLNGAPVTRPGRDRGMVFQQATLFPWWTVERNVAWPLRLGKASKKAAAARARELLALVGLSGFENAYPGELSGGMQQRAALARTLALEPRLLLMDEPFGALDAQTRELMQEELNRIWQQAGTTVIFITHDIYEAVFLGDRVLVMSARPGRVIAEVGIDLPRPRNPEVKSGETFSRHHGELWELLRAEAARAEEERQ